MDSRTFNVGVALTLPSFVALSAITNGRPSSVSKYCKPSTLRDSFCWPVTLYDTCTWSEGTVTAPIRPASFVVAFCSIVSVPACWPFAFVFGTLAVTVTGTEVLTFQVLKTGTAMATFDNLNSSGSSTEYVSVSITVG